MSNYTPTVVNAWAVVDKELETTYYTLTETGEAKPWRAARVELTCLLVDDKEALAGWLIDVRNKNLHLSMATGWRLRWHVGFLKAQPEMQVVYVWWEPNTKEPEETGPWRDLDVAFLRYFSGVDAVQEELQ